METSGLRKALGLILEDKLSQEELSLLRGGVPATAPTDYDSALARVQARLAVLRDEVSRNRRRVRDRYSDLDAEPEGRRRTLLANSPPSMLLALAYGLMERSFAERFADVRRSLELAALAVDVAVLVAETDYVAPGVGADLQAEALGYLGNARRLNADLPGAERALRAAHDFREKGTGDRELHADLLRHLGWLKIDQGHSPEAGALMDREIAIRKLIGDEEKLGETLINRGVVSVWFEPLHKACDFLTAGVERVDDAKMQALALFPIGETLARTGKGLEAWTVACRTDTALLLAGANDLQLWNRAIKGIALRVLGELEQAESELMATRDEFSARGRELQAAMASLELACVYAAQGRFEEVKVSAVEAYAVFAREEVGKEALRALLILRRAVEAQRATEQLVVEVTNFLARFLRNRKLRFEWPAP